MAQKKNVCGAKTRAGTPCKKPAGWGTDHSGTGRCKLHGGASTGPKPESMRGNKNAEKHGLFAKVLPEETMELVDAIDEISPIEILWGNIKIQYAAILRAQKIMEVKSQEEMVKLEKRKSDGEMGESIEYEYHTPWDRQDRFLTAQAKAMTTLTNMIVKYEDLCKSSLVTEEQRLRTEKLKVEIEKIRAGLQSGASTEDQLKMYFEALEAEVKDG